ncbi:MAG TPA: hypothetical protein VKA85_08165 [Candidatus Limnocylindrales bacterium]|nr:hypothetical protein [Candidatus Limnocylindrales bacterium]
MPEQPGARRRSESIDLRFVALFVVLTAALLAPGAWQMFAPTDRQDIGDFVSSLTSRVNEAATIIDRRQAVTAQYFASELENLADATDQERGSLLHHPVEPGARSMLSAATDAAETFTQVAEEAALGYDDEPTLRRIRSRLDGLRDKLDGIAG